MNKQEIEMSIDGLKQLKPILQAQLLKINHDGLGKEDAKELGEHFDIAIECMEQQLTNGWISVSERLPTTDGVFEVTIKGSKGKRRVEMCGFHKDANFDKWGGKYSQLNVIAWRSRPEPYKEVKA